MQNALRRQVSHRERGIGSHIRLTLTKGSPQKTNNMNCCDSLKALSAMSSMPVGAAGAKKIESPGWRVTVHRYLRPVAGIPLPNPPSSEMCALACLNGVGRM